MADFLISLIFRSVYAIAAFFWKIVHILVTDANQRDFYHCIAAKYPVWNFFAHSKYSAYLCNEIWIDKMAINNAKLNNICMAEELFVAERNAKLRYEDYKKLSEM